MTAAIGGGVAQPVRQRIIIRVRGFESLLRYHRLIIKTVMILGWIGGENAYSRNRRVAMLHQVTDVELPQFLVKTGNREKAFIGL